MWGLWNLKSFYNFNRVVVQSKWPDHRNISFESKFRIDQSLTHHALEVIQSSVDIHIKWWGSSYKHRIYIYAQKFWDMPKKTISMHKAETTSTKARHEGLQQKLDTKVGTTTSSTSGIFHYSPVTSKCHTFLLAQP
jgi:hypothetical protein